MSIKLKNVFRHQITLLLCASLFMVLLTSCEAMYSKDDYIQAFSDFITETEENCETYTPSDWKKADIEYNKYANLEYERFKAKFNELDSPAVSKLKVIYIVLKYNAEEDMKKK